MFTYYITFRIADKTANGKTYDERRKSLIDAIRSGGGYWEETTPFILVESKLHTAPLAKHASQGLSAKDDMLVVFDPSDMSCAYFGAVKHPEVLGSFFKTLRQAA